MAAINTASGGLNINSFDKANLSLSTPEMKRQRLQFYWDLVLLELAFWQSKSLYNGGGGGVVVAQLLSRTTGLLVQMVKVTQHT